MSFALWFVPSSDDQPPHTGGTSSRSFSGGRHHRRSHQDQTVIDQLAAGDTDAFERIFREQFNPLTAFARFIVGDADSAVDIVQDVFVTLWRRRATVVLQHSLTTYLHAAVRFLALTRRRDTRTRMRLLGSVAAAEMVEEKRAQPPFGAGEQNDDEERFRAVIAAADQLPVRCREVFYLRWRQGLSYKDIAAVMEISVKTAEAQMTVALRRIRDHVRGGTPI